MNLSEVFGVSRDPVCSYIERDAVDVALENALRGTRQIIIYGSSKQGKTALLQRHLAHDRRITVHCVPPMTAEDLYRSFLRQLNIEIVSERTTETNREVSTSISARFTAMLPFFGGGEAEAKGEAKGGTTEGSTRQTVEFNLAVAQDVGELLLKVGGAELFYVLENFHYLSDEMQRQFAFDLRTFEEMGLRFVILGVWKERNRLVQYNGDLQDRLAEVPVEPWEIQDFERVVATGSPFLNVTFEQSLTDTIFQQAHGSIAVVQELLKKLCEKSGALEYSPVPVNINDRVLLLEAISEKVSEYSARHVRSLESIAAGSRTRRATENVAALYLPYYFVKVMVFRTYAELKDGVERKTLLELIQAQHSVPDNVRIADVSGMLRRLASLQVKAKIVPPLFDYDPGTRRVKVVDSTLYFFVDNCNPEDVMAEIPHPDPGAVEDIDAEEM